MIGEKENMSEKKSINKKIIKIVIAFIVIALIFFQISASLIANKAFLGKGNLQNSAKSKKIISVSLSKNEDVVWLNKCAKQTAIDGENGHKLTALEVKNKDITNSYVIICHPITGDSSTLASHSHHFYDLGFNIIMPDARGCGRSDYKDMNLGLYDSEDILKWINYIIKTDKDSNIFLFGVGMGGSTVLMSSDKNLPANVKGIISDSAYSNINDTLKGNVNRIYKLPKFPTVLTASLYNKITKGFYFGDIDVRKCVKKTEIPILFIHCVEDTVVPIGQSNDLFEVAKSHKSNHVRVPGASHAQGINKNSEKYWQNIDEFIISNLEF